MTEVTRALMVWMRRWSANDVEAVAYFERFVRSATPVEMRALRDDLDSCRAFVDEFDGVLTREEERRKETTDGS